MVFVVDASGSMAARDRMAAVTGAALSLLRDAYQRRDKVAVVTFGLPGPAGAAADHLGEHRGAAPERSGHRRHHTAGRGLLAARDVVVREQARDRSRRPLVVVLTDGRRATGGPDPVRRSHIAAARLVAGTPPRWWSTVRPPASGWDWPPISPGT